VKNLNGQSGNLAGNLNGTQIRILDSRQYFGLNFADGLWYERPWGGIPTFWFSGRLCGQC
jgi:hypothetical protein